MLRHARRNAAARGAVEGLLTLAVGFCRHGKRQAQLRLQLYGVHMIRCPSVAERPLQTLIAGVLQLEIAPPKVSRDSVVW